MQKYQLVETIPTVSGEKRYCLNEVVYAIGEIPVVIEKVKGDKETVLAYMRDNNIKVDEVVNEHE